ncbi:MAG: hypothetical protein HN337_04180 [Deltaproteobacteria bacterium]|jgi:hypothetical protein|nr:hypothetical protein [Deltaproteobacteria bacterium]
MGRGIVTAALFLFKMLLKRLSELSRYTKWIFLFGLFLFAISYFMKDGLPGQNEIDSRLLLKPIQKETAKEPFGVKFDDKLYSIKPKYRYDLYGLIVSARDLNKTWYNIDYENDPFNIKDLCVIWGGNLASSDFRRIEYSSGLWTCYIRYPAGVTFVEDALSNNHLLPSTPEISKKLSKAGIGDQIHFRGYLVDYLVEGSFGERRSSTNRHDRGNGACEVVYVEDFQIIKNGNVVWEFLYSLSKYIILFAIVVWVYFNLMNTPTHLRR